MPKQTTSRQKRSSYPYISIKEAVNCIEKLKSAEGYAEVPVGIALSKMGYSPTSSTSDRILSALVSYGLLDQRGVKDNKFVRLSHLAKRILLNPDGNQDRTEAIHQAALNDDIVKKMVDKWQNGLPSKENIVKTLILDHEFNERAASRFATVIQETFETIDFSAFGQGSLIDQGEVVEEDQEDQVLALEESKIQEGTKATVDKLTDYPIPLEGGKRHVIFRAPPNLTKKDFEYIIQYLGILKLGLAQEDTDE